MPTSAAHTALAIPELIFSVAAHLAPHDLAQCISVCRAWSRQFEPILWTNVHLKKDHDKPLNKRSIRKALIRNRPLIRTMRLSAAHTAVLGILFNGSATDPSTQCTKLKRLEFDGDSLQGFSAFKNFSDAYRASISRDLAMLLHLNHDLTHLKAPLELIGTSAVVVAMSQVKTLQHLTVYSSEDCEDCQAILALLEACLPLPNLTELFFDLDLASDGWQGSPMLEATIKAASIARFSQNPSAVKIKSLQLPSNRKENWNPLPLLLLKSNLLDLESFEIPWFDDETDLDQLEEVVREHCPNLKRLTSFKDQEHEGYHVEPFIRGCARLQSFVSDHFSYHDYYGNSRDTLSTLVSRHYNTLENLELTHCYQVSSAEQQEVLSRCKHLRRFWVLNSYKAHNGIGMDFEDICSKDWVCMDLTKLGLTLQRAPRTGAAKHLYTQIGRLQNLEVLALGADVSQRIKVEASEYAWDLTLSKGWLREMADLKNLRSLHLHIKANTTLSKNCLIILRAKTIIADKCRIREGYLILSGGFGLNVNTAQYHIDVFLVMLSDLFTVEMARGVAENRGKWQGQVASD
ncbi:hypothetical protein BGZ72_005827 [Mortierella alpina]|nr:hypothetical protein BGZ72_005827 [Mortierella alpina]